MRLHPPDPSTDLRLRRTGPRSKLTHLFLALVVAAGALVFLQSSPASAVEAQWIRVKIRTGDDDKRDDTKVTLILRTTTGDRRIEISPTGERLADRTTKDDWFLLPTPVLTERITGCALDVDRGEGGWPTGADEWWMTGLEVSAWSGTETPLFNFTSWSHKFSSDQIKECPVEPSINGRMSGNFFVDYGGSGFLRATFSGTPAATTATVAISGLGAVNCYGRHAITPATHIATGSRVGYDYTGLPIYQLGFSFTSGGRRANVTIRGTLSDSGSRFRGSLTVWVDAPDPLADCNRPGTFDIDR